MEADTKSYPNCFTVGPIIDDGATRTYFISCCKCHTYSSMYLVHMYVRNKFVSGFTGTCVMSPYWV